MKKIYFLSLLVFASANAQIPNSGFEMGTGYGLENVTAWGQFFMTSVIFNPETGGTTTDEITFGDGAIGNFCTSLTDPHSGERAMLIRNAYNVTQQYVIPGKVGLFNTEISESPTGWNAGIPLEPNADIQFLSFWYKFAPTGNDVAEATLNLFNDASGLIGTAKIQISEATDTYTYVSVPVTFTTIGGPGFITIEFSMAAEGSTPVFGSTLLVDDLAVNPSMLQTNSFAHSSFSVWPTIASQEINIMKNGKASAQNFKIINIEGKVVNEKMLKLSNENSAKIDVSALANGVYIVRADDGVTAKFIKK